MKYKSFHIEKFKGIQTVDIDAASGSMLFVWSKITGVTSLSGNLCMGTPASSGTASIDTVGTAKVFIAGNKLDKKGNFIDNNNYVRSSKTGRIVGGSFG